MLSNDIFAEQAENLKKIANHLYCLSALPQRKQFKTQVKQKWKITFLIHFFFYLIGPTKQFRSHKKDYS